MLTKELVNAIPVYIYIYIYISISKNIVSTGIAQVLTYLKNILKINKLVYAS